MVDLHCHTKNSDGTWSVIELLKEAEKMNVDILSITDHDTVKSHFELENINIKDYYSGKIIVGSEINCIFNKSKIELLCYDFDKENVQKWLDKKYNEEKIKESFFEEFNDLINLCHKKNVKISENLTYQLDMGYPFYIVHEDIKKYPENRKFFDEETWNSNKVFYRKCTTDETFFMFDDFNKSLPQAKEVSDLIRKNGGKVFLAHLFIYEMDNHMSFLEELKDANIIDGVECFYSKFNDKQIKLIENFCKSNNLFMSGGTDCHGEVTPNIKLGIGYGNLKVKQEEILKWIN